jgi:ABC-type lipoprotein export system ATPase subunit
MTTDREPLIQLEHVMKIFYTDEIETHALADVHLSIQRGEYVSIEGPSGSGTTTLLSILGLPRRRGVTSRSAVSRRRASRRANGPPCATDRSASSSSLSI